jgi:hypothetical protein
MHVKVAEALMQQCLVALLSLLTPQVAGRGTPTATMPLYLYLNTLGASRRPAAGGPRLILVPVTSVRMSATCVQLMASRTTGIVWPAYFSGSANTTAGRAHAARVNSRSLAT